MPPTGRSPGSRSTAWRRNRIRGARTRPPTAIQPISRNSLTIASPTACRRACIFVTGAESGNIAIEGEIPRRGLAGAAFSILKAFGVGFGAGSAMKAPLGRAQTASTRDGGIDEKTSNAEAHDLRLLRLSGKSRSSCVKIVQGQTTARRRIRRTMRRWAPLRSPYSYAPDPSIYEIKDERFAVISASQ